MQIRKLMNMHGRNQASGELYVHSPSRGSAVISGRAFRVPPRCLHLSPRRASDPAQLFCPINRVEELIYIILRRASQPLPLGCLCPSPPLFIPPREERQRNNDAAPLHIQSRRVAIQRQAPPTPDPHLPCPHPD